MAAVAHLSPYRFTRQFKAATGLALHQYLTARRVERAQHLLRKDDELELVHVALRAGFSDQSRFSFHFKRIVGVTPRQFRTFRKNHLKEGEFRQEIGRDVLLVYFSSRTKVNRAAVKKTE